MDFIIFQIKYNIINAKILFNLEISIYILLLTLCNVPFKITKLIGIVYNVFGKARVINIDISIKKEDLRKVVHQRILFPYYDYNVIYIVYYGVF